MYNLVDVKWYHQYYTTTIKFTTISKYSTISMTHISNIINIKPIYYMHDFCSPGSN